MMINRYVQLSLILLANILVICLSWATPSQSDTNKSQINAIEALLFQGSDQSPEALTTLRETWDIQLVPMLLETIYLSRDYKTSNLLFELLEDKTGQSFGFDMDAWYQWLWRQDYDSHPLYPDFKSRLYGLIDAAFSDYFDSEPKPKIRLDEVRWGGVRQDGIPPLREPKMISAEAASYLEDEHIVFGLEVNGDARAYPKRILAWHEMFVDSDIGGESISGVYCTLCGSMIVYRNTLGDSTYQLGTSGFLYRSNKLMYDQKTQSLWSTLRGVPVIGPLSNRPIKLERLSVVTTTWGAWRKAHPDTTVLSLDTGHPRDYSEGAAYRAYFATDELMFTVPELDTRLRNKDEIVALSPESERHIATAIDVNFLKANPIFPIKHSGQKLIAITDASGAARIYKVGDVTLTRVEAGKAYDNKGQIWQVEEKGLVSLEGTVLSRYPSHRAFWFAWFNTYPDTQLIR